MTVCGGLSLLVTWVVQFSICLNLKWLFTMDFTQMIAGAQSHMWSVKSNWHWHTLAMVDYTFKGKWLSKAIIGGSDHSYTKAWKCHVPIQSDMWIPNTPYISNEPHITQELVACTIECRCYREIKSSGPKWAELYQIRLESGEFFILGHE